MDKYKILKNFKLGRFNFGKGEILECDRIILNIIYHYDSNMFPIEKIRNGRGSKEIFEYMDDNPELFELFQ